MLFNPSVPCGFSMADMANCLQYFWGLSFLISLYFIQSISTSHVYIVYLGHNQFRDPIFTSNSHVQLLSKVFSNEQEAKQSVLYSYKHTFSGFSAILNSTQATDLKKMKEVISVFRSRTLKLHTTRSWDFLGLPLGQYDTSAQPITTPLQLAYGHDVIVGILDSGIWPESQSFKEEAAKLGPIPSRWKGECVKGQDFDPKEACNKKLIGARYYLNGYEQRFGRLNNTSHNEEYKSARDHLGHGTHTASTAVGSIVKNASFYGFGLGTARGGAPRARLAVYKVCWGVKNFVSNCVDADVMAAFDDALHDGVDVISVSFGLDQPQLLPFFIRSADIGSFHAMQLGVSVVFSAGNGGPVPASVGNVAPWSISVAASSIDRSFPTKIILQNNFFFVGESLIPHVIIGELATSNQHFNFGICEEELLTKSAEGKVILCYSSIGPSEYEVAQVAVKKANALALIFVDYPTNQIAAPYIIPTVFIDITQGTKLNYYRAQFGKRAMVKILPSRSAIGRSPAPVVAPFSSRGPSSLTPDILKPDVTAPGINILAAWPPKTPPTYMPSYDDRRVDWNFQSGTSMSCPHVSGVVALLKSMHPNWSPAMIRSALITTAYTKDTSLDNILSGGTMKDANPFDIGAGHINPSKAMDPGLVYDMKTRDYIIFLCNIGYTEKQISLIILPIPPGIDISCSYAHFISNANINYPSITVSNLQSAMTIKRTIRNVGPKQSVIYFARVVNPHGVEVHIWPPVLIFSCFKEELSYFVTLKPLKKSQGRYDFGEIVWSDGFHNVRSPLVVQVNNAGDINSDLATAFSK